MRPGSAASENKQRYKFGLKEKIVYLRYLCRVCSAYGVGNDQRQNSSHVSLLPVSSLTANNAKVEGHVVFFLTMDLQFCHRDCLHRDQPN